MITIRTKITKELESDSLDQLKAGILALEIEGYKKYGHIAQTGSTWEVGMVRYELEEV